MKIPSNIQELYVTRLIVLLEDEPQSNTYRQVLLTPEEFKGVSTAIGKVLAKKKNDIETVQVTLSRELYPLPDLKETRFPKNYEKN